MIGFRIIISILIVTSLQSQQDKILNGDLDKAPTQKTATFQLEIPTELPNIDSNILWPRNSWEDVEQYKSAAKKLSGMFRENFKKFTDTPEGKTLEQFGPVSLNS